MVNRRKGFTLAELLIVVAIVGILVAVSIPIFSSQLEKSREATDLANMRAAKALAVATYYDIMTNSDKPAEINGLAKGGNDGAGGSYYQGFYDPATGKFSKTPNNKLKGKGTSQDTGTDYDGKYFSSKDYREMGIFVQIVYKRGNGTPMAFNKNFRDNVFKGNDEGIHVAWRYTNTWGNLVWDCGYDFTPGY